MRRLYVDTNIYLDYWGDRSDGLRPLGEFAFQLMERAIGCEFAFIVSDFVLLELRKHATEKECKQIFGSLKERKKIIFARHKREDKLEAKRIARERGIPWQDALHVLIAKKFGAECMVTRDRHFWGLQGLLEAKLPEDV